jgi:hypothetical protein
LLQTTNTTAPASLEAKIDAIADPAKLLGDDLAAASREVDLGIPNAKNKNMIKLLGQSSCINIVSAVVSDILLGLVPSLCGQYCTPHAQQLVYEFERISRSNSFRHLDTIPVTIQCASRCPIFQRHPDSSSGAVMRANDAKASFFADPTSGRAPLRGSRPSR